jgi:archaellum component FlaC
MQRTRNYWLTRTILFSLSIVLGVDASSPSWAGIVSVQQCQEAAAGTRPMPPSCTERRVKTIIHTDKQGQPTCKVRRVQYLCMKPNGDRWLSGRDEFIPLVPEQRCWLDKALFPDAEAKDWKFPWDGSTPYGVPVAGVSETFWEGKIRYYYRVNEDSTNVPKVNELVAKLNNLQQERDALEKERAVLEGQRTRINSARRRANWRDQNLENQFKEIERKLYGISGQVSDVAYDYNNIVAEIKELHKGYTEARRNAGICGQKFPTPERLNFPF